MIGIKKHLIPLTIKTNKQLQKIKGIRKETNVETTITNLIKEEHDRLTK